MLLLAVWKLIRIFAHMNQECTNPSFAEHCNEIFRQVIRDYHLKDDIDKSNQDRTDLVEQIDAYFRQRYSDVQALPDAQINTESPAWAIDRLSILALKIYHMKEQTERTDASPEHIEKCGAKLAVLQEQQADLSTAIDQLLADIAAGRKYMKVYMQMKMYNDPATNPVLYGKKE